MNAELTFCYPVWLIVFVEHGDTEIGAGAGFIPIFGLIRAEMASGYNMLASNVVQIYGPKVETLPESATRFRRMFISTREGSVDGRAQNSVTLELRDYERILRLLEDCGSARSLGSFRETVLEGLARHLGYRNTTFLVGTTPSAVFADPEPVTTGRPSRMVPAYAETFNRLDPFATLARRSPHPSAEPLSLDSFAHLRHPDHREYLDRFLFRHGIHAKVVIPFRNQAMAAGIGLLAEEAGTFGPSDMARATALMPHLANLFTLHTAPGGALPISGLTARQTEIARMAVNGATNRQIAQALFITVDTVKKHLTSVYDAAGCTNRTELAAKWHTSGSRPLPASSRHRHIPELYS